MFKMGIIKKKICPVCKRKFVVKLGIHLNSQKDSKHTKFKKEQTKFLIKKFLKGLSPRDISNLKNNYANYFGAKYVYYVLSRNLGSKKFEEISKRIMGEKISTRWKKMSVEKRKDLMKNVRDFQWKDLTSEQKRNHPWVKAGLKASLESSKKGSKNQNHLYKLLLKTFPNLKWKYNYTIKDSWHIDVACLEKKLFIEWDGRHHRVPIHGPSYLNNRKNRDKLKNNIVTSELKGTLLRIKDDGRENFDFVKSKVEKIKELINLDSIKEKVIQI